MMYSFATFAVAAQGQQQPNFLISMGPMILVFAIMYFLLIRPQQQKTKQHREMVSRLKSGDRVITTGGLFGTVAGVNDKTVMVKVADNMELEVARSAIATVREDQHK